MPYLKVEEAAAELQMSPEWVRRQCKAGVIPATKLGRAYRINAGDLDTFMRKYRGGEVPVTRTRLKGARRRVG